jgi:alkanesulfonate monooxygenase SsuD/methylene tetrahydromethanopterin reductase-like flavin-dependent oxidoreductase (luciferase family)
MDIGVMISGSGLGGVVDAARDAAEAGVRRVWIPQVFGVEALTAIAVAGREIPGVEFGTAVVPTYPRHPLVLAGQALTTSAALGEGRLHLGIGLSHQLVIEGMLGMAFEKPARHMREYLSALRPALDGQPVAVTGETLAANTLMGPLKVDGPGARPPPGGGRTGRRDADLDGLARGRREAHRAVHHRRRRGRRAAAAPGRNRAPGGRDG